MKTIVFACSLAALVAAGAVGASGNVSTPIGKLDRALRQLVSMRGGPPGVTAVIQRGTRRVVLRRGVADRSSGRPIALRDRWRIASVSKAFSGAVALKLVARGRLGLDDTIAQRLPQFPDAWGRVTLRQALQHTSGLPDYSASPGFRAQVMAHPRQSVEPSKLLSWVAGEDLRFTPGSKYRYSNTDNVVVAFFVQAVTGLSYERALREVVLDPLALRATSMPAGYRMPAPYVHGYDGKQDVSEDLSPTLAWASGGLVSTPMNLTRFIRAYGGGRLFGGATRAAQLRFRPGESEPAGPGVNGAGLAIFRYRTSCGTVYGHTGNFLGYTAFIATSADGRRSVTIQASTQLAPGAGDRRAYQALRRAFGLGVCAALS
jgi:D-alanyl-D-alanine carboxypeptidase